MNGDHRHPHSEGHHWKEGQPPAPVSCLEESQTGKPPEFRALEDSAGKF